MSLKYCFEENRVKATLQSLKKSDLAVIDSDGIPDSVIRAAVRRGVFVYDYENAGAIEKERSYFRKFQGSLLAPYSGWPGEFWVDPTTAAWKRHLIETAEAKKKKGADGLYFDNADIYWMCREGFQEEGARMMRGAPDPDKVYTALVEVIREIVEGLGVIVMPNGADVFVRRMFSEGHGYLIRTVNQEGVLYENNKRQSNEETVYRTAYLDWAKKKGLYVRGIEYTKSKTAAAKARAYYKKHGWQGIYISKHTDLRGD